MMPVAERTAIATTGRMLAAAQARSASRRMAPLVNRRAPPAPSVRFDDLARAPEWLGWDEARRFRLFNLVALGSVAPALATSIDGDWLGTLAQAAGEDALDWAIQRHRAGSDDDEKPLGDVATDVPPPLSAADLSLHGAALLASTLPPGLAGYLSSLDDVTPVALSDIDVGALATDAVAFVGAVPESTS